MNTIESTDLYLKVVFWYGSCYGRFIAFEVMVSYENVVGENESRAINMTEISRILHIVYGGNLKLPLSTAEM